MTLVKRMRIGAMALVCAAVMAAPALAAGPQALSPWDAQRYAAAFDAVDQADFIEAEMQAVEIKDRSLTGYLKYRQLMHPTAHRASFEELAAWLARYADLPGADRIYGLAVKRKPSDAKAPREPVLTGTDWQRVELVAQGVAGPLPVDRAKAAREAFYSGDIRRALDLAPAAGEKWIAGLAAYRLRDFVQAETWFSKVAADEGEDEWLRAAGAYWASRSAQANGDGVRANAHLRNAAHFTGTFYGMIAERQSKIQTAGRPQQLSRAETGQYIEAAYTGTTVDLKKFIKDDARAHRAVALAQIGKVTEAGLELRAGLALAKGDAERDRWTALILSLNAPLSSRADIASPSPVRSVVRRANSGSGYGYPTPVLEPKWGFTLDKALVYAIVRQESRFNPNARSPVGAVGLMQLMPEAAARAAGDDKLKADMSPLLDPAFNLRVGQDYVTWLMERGVGYDLLRTVAAYNGGPGTLLKTAKMVGDDDSLLIIECLPSQESRNYVEKVVAAYWTYRGMFGQDSKTLDALASGARFVDARLDK